MEKRNQLLDKVSTKTHVSKEDILALANDLQHKDLSNESDIKEFVYHISKMTGKEVSDTQMNKIISVIKNNKVPDSIDKLV
jgi:uncharacterized protein YpuA (DUF1002 family)